MGWFTVFDTGAVGSVGGDAYATAQARVSLRVHPAAIFMVTPAPGDVEPPAPKWL
jgi:hypothetical protein